MRDNRGTKMSKVFRWVDPFLGCDGSQLPDPQGIAAAWFFPKAQVGNTHPGACFPLGMVSVCPHSGAYPTGYGVNKDSYEGLPTRLFPAPVASGFTHFQQSGTGYIGKFYNYLRVTPFAGEPPAPDAQWELKNESAAPGYYRCDLGDTGIGAEFTVDPRAAFHRYTFSEAGPAGLVVDLSYGGVTCKPLRPTAAEYTLLDDATLEGWLLVNGIKLFFRMEVAGATGKQASLWCDGAESGGGRSFAVSGLDEYHNRKFGVCFRFSAKARGRVYCRIGFSWRSLERAREAAERIREQSFNAVVKATQAVWAGLLGRVEVSADNPADKVLLYTSLYRSLIKPIDCSEECFLWDNAEGGPFFTDLATMWDIYKTQLPLLLTVWPGKGAEVLQSMLGIARKIGNFPNDLLLAPLQKEAVAGFQARCLAQVNLLDAWVRRVPGFDWNEIVQLMARDILSDHNRDFLEKGILYPLSQSLDLAYAAFLTAHLATAVGNRELAAQMRTLSVNWRNAYDPETGLLRDSVFYEGEKWNYSFRLHQDLQERIQLMGGEAAFVAALDRFFGYGQQPAPLLRHNCTYDDVPAGLKLCRFEGMNNEPDMETPYMYHFAGRPDRTAEVVRAVLQYRFATGRGGLPGNDDSGGLSSWYVWSALGLFPVAGQDLFLIGSPVFKKARIRLQDAEVTIRAVNASQKNIYVQRAEWNGRPLDRAFLRWRELAGGGVLTLRMGAKPSQWGRQCRPTPFETGSAPSPA